MELSSSFFKSVSTERYKKARGSRATDWCLVGLVQAAWAERTTARRSSIRLPLVSGPAPAALSALRRAE